MRSRVSLWFSVCLVPILVSHAFPNSGSGEDREEKGPKSIISLAESMKKTRESLRDPEVERVRKRYWEQTFKDIRSVSSRRDAMVPPANGRAFFARWKLLLEEPTAAAPTVNGVNETTMSPKRSTKRFDGFPSWERLRKEWSDDVEDYLARIQTESGGDYSLGNYGRAPINATTIGTAKDYSQKGPKVKLPVPVPAKAGEPILPYTDIANKSMRIEIVTTASLPWRTGTAVNPLLRAAFMTRGRKEAGGSVTLMLPWLEKETDQIRVYGAGNTFNSTDAQEEYIRTWLREDANMPQESEDLRIRWYTAWQNPAENSVYGMGDIIALIPADEVDICILEEPEHLNWYRAPGDSWTSKFKHVVGIVHTNYFQYALDQPAAWLRAPAMRLLVSWMCRAHCHRIIKLSGTLDKFAPEKELVENVHGVRNTFLDVGSDLCKKLQSPDITSDPVFAADAPPTVYFIGKMLWSKGLGSLMELLKFSEEDADLKVMVDMYGGGPDRSAAEKQAEELGLSMPFHGPIDHAALGSTHKIFVNPSTSEVLCTTSAEALAMGKFVILPSHPSNDFFAQFPNCLSYTSKEEFVGNLYYALTHSPQPMTEEFLYPLTWEAATERLAAAGCIPVAEAETMKAAMTSADAGIEISLPPLVESEEGRRAITTTLRFTRQRYRHFRNRLSSEVDQNKFLPASLRERIKADLDKRLDIDFDELLESPKLTLKLSPAELDKSLLEFYNLVSQSPGGDIFRVIGGGGPVALQNLYMKRIGQRERRRASSSASFLPDSLDIETPENDRTASQWVRWAMKRNLSSQKKRLTSAPKDDETVPRMSFAPLTSSSYIRPSTVSSTSFVPRRSIPTTLLI